ncbi:glycosyltransferase family 4 protein [Thiomicrorhabdus xiamenensis]|uniref:Glycosyltransferase family 1 protein n=1 Tax=Thiomicrorhabdus xiamenensis TaxID=2739063 RepID=A0A7D4NQA3_9GAMM|nr:glycosyltransferase family 1 protein [Thiomicrorhabdus xiamenensis]QKI88677.1 glycosyltransferase family 1 protein [Thiomicrorhabdus xiamenensis]
MLNSRFFAPDEIFTLSGATASDKTIRKLLLVTDAWYPQVNGVVTTLSHLIEELRLQGMTVEVINPENYRTFPLPTYPEIRLVTRAPDLEARIRGFQPDAIHIATEGTLGWKVRALALKNNWPFTSAYHTKYPQYIRQRLPFISEKWIYKLLYRFHQPAQATFVPALSIREELEEQGFSPVKIMSRGVDRQIFRLYEEDELEADFPFDRSWPRPFLLYVGRVAPEKNIQAFLDLDIPGTKIVVGDGPQLFELQTTYPQVKFLGKKKGIALARCYAAADVFVFPSLTDTFGVVNIEAMACGTPVAAFNVTGPKDSVRNGVNGFLDDDLDYAIEQALRLKDTHRIARSVDNFNWRSASKQFTAHLAKIAGVF